VKQNYLNQKIHETEVVNQIGRRKHINSLKLNYSKAPFFNEFLDIIENLYEENEKLLSAINLKFIRGFCDILNIRTKFIYSRDLKLQGDKSQRGQGTLSTFQHRKC